jgi:non-lysosomal glucosylceramidase
MSHIKPSCHCSAAEGCGPQHRRDFLNVIGLGATALAAGRPLMAGLFEPSEFDKLIPADKKLSAQWIQSLFARGTHTVYRGVELEKIGMPIGGICTGQVYLGGDGRLWHWDVFNQHIATTDSHYVNPPKSDFPFEQGFAVRMGSGEKAIVRALDHRGFADISFTGEYPIGYVEYRDLECPVSRSRSKRLFGFRPAALAQQLPCCVYRCGRLGYVQPAAQRRFTT